MKNIYTKQKKYLYNNCIAFKKKMFYDNSKIIKK